MPQITVAPYTFRVRVKMGKGVERPKKGVRFPFLPVQSFCEGGDLFSVFRSALLLEEGEDKTSLVTKKVSMEIESESAGFIDGWFKVGRSGYGSDIHDEEGEKVFKREKNHTEFIPLYFQLWAPKKDSDVAILILQSFDKFSVKTHVNDKLLKKFVDLHPEYLLLLMRLFDVKQAKHALRHSPIRKVRFIQKKVPKDQADKLRDGAGSYGGELELVLKTKGDNPFGLREAIISAVGGQTKINEIIEMDDFDFQDLKVELEIGGAKRTMNIARADNLNTSFDISEDIETDNDGHPVLESIREYCTNLAKNLVP